MENIIVVVNLSVAKYCLTFVKCNGKTPIENTNNYFEDLKKSDFYVNSIKKIKENNQESNDKIYSKLINYFDKIGVEQICKDIFSNNFNKIDLYCKLMLIGMELDRNKIENKFGYKIN